LPPPVVQSFDSLFEFADIWDGIFAFAIDIEASAKLVQLRIQVNQQDIRDCNIVYVANASLRGVLGGYVVP
jgi:hypothetical protein